MVKLVDTKDLKSLPYGSASSSLAEGTKLKYMKIHFVFDKTNKAKLFKRNIKKFYKSYSLSKSECIVVAGGDGFMLQVLKKFYKQKKDFYGINCGSYGFLMNKKSFKNLEIKILKAKKNIINPLDIVVNTKDSKKKYIAINDVSLFRQSRQTASLKLKINNKTIIKKLIGDGVLISSPAGSTAYNLSVHGPILSLNSGKIAITPISPFRPRRWAGKVVSDKLSVHIKNLDANKRPVAATADNIEIRNVLSLSVKVNKKIKIGLLHDSGESLVKKIKIEQIRRELY